MAAQPESPGSDGRPLDNTVIIHSPTLVADTRGAALRLLEAHVAQVTRPGGTSVMTEPEPSTIAADPTLQATTIVDTDAAKMPDASMRPFMKQLNHRQISNALKHHRALRLIAERAAQHDPSGFSMVVEDDALFTHDMQAALQRVVRQAPASVDIVMLGLPSAADPSPDGCFAFEDTLARFAAFPACESYLIRNSAAARVASAFLPIRLPTNMHLTHVVRLLGGEVKVAHSVPNVFVDGSKLGMFASVVDTNNQLLWNPSFCKMSALLGCWRQQGREKAARTFSDLWDEQPYKEHPDVLALRAAWLAETEAPEDAEDAFADAMRAYEANKCVMDNTSQFLRRYVALYRDLQ